MDILNISGLAVSTRIGVHAWEQRISQRLLLDISLPSDFRNCEDDLAKTIDYDRLCQDVIQFVESRSFQLIETVADKVATFINERFSTPSVTVSVSKPDAVRQARNIQVTVTRTAA
ncbi:dihydroneopterin aldolase [Legionella sp. CNM-4043-24]|uniref:dihydroneopterin aldolase n=1 Tax=Legionella sp. CNM-4043-24 TaxID=3421646 RepID=UPI00403ABFAD